MNWPVRRPNGGNELCKGSCTRVASPTHWKPSSDGVAALQLLTTQHWICARLNSGRSARVGGSSGAVRETIEDVDRFLKR